MKEATGDGRAPHAVGGEAAACVGTEEGSGGSSVACAACGGRNSVFNARCARCRAPLHSSEGCAWPSDVARGVESSGFDAFATTLPAGPAGPAAPRGAALGRFEVIGPIGRGAFGDVVHAIDPGLGREVAIKVLRAVHLEGSGAEAARARLVREARAMAKIRHPNVVTVYEVDAAGAEVLVVMDYVEGTTLRALCGPERRPAAEVITAFVRAGRGLAEVHRAGLVHRDFKPDNVLVGLDGRVCVTDFGLVGPSGGGAESAPSREGGVFSPSLTRLGARLGTPAYMAPEQHEGKAVDARADQFAFCVSLWEALTGERPFAGESYAELRANVLAGARPVPPRGVALPARVQKVLARGLATSPEARYPDMNTLLADLERDPWATRRRVSGVAGALGLVGLAAFGLARRAPREGGLCGGGETKLAGVWDGATKARVRAAFDATRAPDAADAFRRVERALDTRAAAWVTMYADSCEATQVRGEQSFELLDRRTACLERHRQEMGALTALFARRLDADVFQRAVPAALGLTGLEDCADVDALGAAVPPPASPDARARIEALRGGAAEARALDAAGKPGEALALARPLVDQARAEGYAPLEAEALVLLGRLEAGAHEPRAAEASLREAALAAARARDDALAAEALTELIDVVGRLEARHADALALQLAAEGAVERVGRDSLASARLFSVLGRVIGEQGRRDEALAYAERSLALFEATLGPQHPKTVSSIGRLAGSLLDLERYADAEFFNRRVIALREQTLGPDHPLVALGRSNLANLLNTTGREAEALIEAERALAVQERALGPTHDFVAFTLTNVALSRFMLGDAESASERFERALMLRTRALGPDHPEVAWVISGIGAAQYDQGKYAEAEASHARALAIRLAALGPKHELVAISRAEVGKALVGQKRYAEGVAHLERALAAAEAALGPGSLYVADTLSSLGSARVTMGRPESGLPLLERALAIYDTKAGDVHPLALADSRQAAATALWASGGDRRRASDLATLAREAYAHAASAHARRALGRTDAWLATHRAPPARPPPAPPIR